MWICKEYEFYTGICPALQNRQCNSEFPCGNKISLMEYQYGCKKITSAKALLEKCGYTVIKNDLFHLKNNR